MIQKKTIIYIHAIDPLEVSWIVYDEQGRVAQFQYRSQLFPEEKNNSVYVILPGQDILITEVEMPKLNKQRLMQALPYQMEEQLVDDVALLHFAMGEQKANGTLSVAVIAHEKMNQLLMLLQQHGLRPQGVFSSMFALPVTENHWHVMLQDDSCVARIAINEGFTCDQASFLQFVDLTVSHAAAPPESIYLYNTSQAKLIWQHPLIKLNQLHLAAEPWLQKISEWIFSYPTINLLQGIYQAKHEPSESKKIWTMAGMVVLAWVAVALLGNVVSFFMLHRQVATLDMAINTIYKKNFPEATSLVAPRERMSDQLKKISEQENKNYFLLLLAISGDALKNASSVRFGALDFRDNQLNLELSAATFDDLDKFSQFFVEQGFAVKQQNAAAAGSQVKANLIVQRGES